MNNEPDSFDLETQRLLDKVCEGVEVPEDLPPLDDLQDDLEDDFYFSELNEETA